jgi:hypothetical protein
MPYLPRLINTLNVMTDSGSTYVYDIYTLFGIYLF